MTPRKMGFADMAIGLEWVWNWSGELRCREKRKKETTRGAGLLSHAVIALGSRLDASI
jgi:hypothetical protein